VEKVILHFNGGVILVDHTTIERLEQFISSFEENRGIPVTVIGLDTMESVSKHHAAVRIRRPDTLAETNHRTPVTLNPTLHV